MKLGKKDLSVVSVMLFALFFGAGDDSGQTSA